MNEEVPKRKSPLRAPSPAAAPDRTVDHHPTHATQPPSEVPTETGFAVGPNSHPSAIDVGSTLGPYELVEKVGQGGMGAVYKARHTRLRKIVAIKVLPPSAIGNAEAIARFDREMEAVGKITHPNIVQAHDAGEIGGVHYLAMEYVEGNDLSKLVKKLGPFKIADACKVIVQAAKGLAVAHAAGLIHRDIKPANMLLSKEGRLKLLDLGLARLTDGDGRLTELTNTGQSFGTPDYMAPEQWNDSHTVDGRADLYALGCSLFFLLVGRAPYQTEKGGTIAGKMRAHILGDIPKLEDHRPDAPPELAAIYWRLMAKDPSQRIQSAAELAQRLLPLAAGKGTTTNTQTYISVGSVARELLPSSYAPTIAPSQTRTTFINPAVLKRRKKGPPAWIVGAMLFSGAGMMAAVVWIAIVLIGRNGGPTRTKGKGDIEAAKKVKSQGINESAIDAVSTDSQDSLVHPPKPAIAPFTAQQARKHQEEWAAYLEVPVEYTNSVGMKFSLIPPGEFLMGCDEQETKASLDSLPDESSIPESEWGYLREVRVYRASQSPRRRVRLTQPFYLGRHEVTQAQYEKVMGVNPSQFSKTGTNKAQADLVAGLDTSDFPVDNVSWQDAADFCNRLSETERLSPCFALAGKLTTWVEGMGYRMPTEAEWEYSCRAGTTTRFWAGNGVEDLERTDWVGKVCERSFAAHRPAKVGARLPNPFGLHDVHGNQCEWVYDGWDEGRHDRIADGAAVDPVVHHGFLRMLRSSNYSGDQFHAAAATRTASWITHQGAGYGIRVSLSISAVRQALAPRPAGAPRPAIAPFSAQQARKHQEEWAAYLKLPVEWKNSIGMKFVLIPPGQFMMGSTPEEVEAALKIIGPDDWHSINCAKSEAPRHEVILTQPFYMGACEVTQKEYEAVLGVNPSHCSPTGLGKDLVVGLDTSNHPVENVSWNDAAEFCAKLSEREKLAPFYSREGESIAPLKGTGYRLPTEAQWEFACRAGTVTRYWSGDDEEALKRVGWYVENSENRTHAVGELSANPFGIFDIHGNAHEWADDLWEPDFYARVQGKPTFDPLGLSAEVAPNRLARGGHWNYWPSHCRSAFRGHTRPTWRTNFFGMRVTCGVDVVRQSQRDGSP